MSDGKGRVLFVGLDAADSDLIGRWARKGALPHLRRLLATSLAIPTTSPPGAFVGAIWPCLYTGVNPARHGCHSWQQLHPGTYDLYRYYAGTNLKREPFWNVLGRAGKRVGIVDVPLTSPSPNLNGVQVVEWGCHDPEHGFRTWPESLAPELEARFGRHPVERNCNAHRGLDDYLSFRDDLVRGVAGKTALSAFLYGQEPWDLFATVFSESHCVGHQCYHLHDPTHDRYSAAISAEVGDPIADVYKAIDAALGQLLDQAPGDTTVMVLASHGMGPHYDGCFVLPTILERLGLMDASGQFSRHRCFTIKNNSVSGAIRVNRAGREPQGLIGPGAAFDAFCEELRHDLLEVINLETGTPLVRDVLRTSELFQGEYLDHLPDLFVEWDHRFPVASIGSPRIGTIHKRWHGCRTGDHTPDGLLLVQGPGIAPGRLTRKVSVMDLAPTMAALVGVPLADVDGRVIPEMLPIASTASVARAA